MRRREFIGYLIGGAISCSSVAPAQQRKTVRRIGFISGASSAAAAGIIAGFLQGMQELGYTEGKDFTVEYRFAEGKYERFFEFSSEFARLKVDVIVLGTTAAIRALEQTTADIPIVMGYSTDPVGSGFVASLARPGGRITGLASSLDEMVSKQVQFMEMTVPGMRRLGVLTNPENPMTPPVLKGAEAAARQIGVAFVPVAARDAKEIDAAFSGFSRDQMDAAIVAPDAFFHSQHQRLVDLAIEARLPTIFAQREYVDSGGLMSYGDSLSEFLRRAATFVDKIFKGATPADLPVEQPTLFKLVINRRTADMLGLTIPLQLYALADEVIE